MKVLRLNRIKYQQKISLDVHLGLIYREQSKDARHLKKNTYNIGINLLIINFQREADTKIVLHALDATANGATEIKIHSPDTDVFILALRRYSELCQNTVFVTGKGDTYRTIKLQPIVRALGPLKSAALPSFHVLTGADNTGSFAKKGKPNSWSVFNEAHDDDVIQALSQLGTSDPPRNETLEAVEKLVCQLFLSKTNGYVVLAIRLFL